MIRVDNLRLSVGGFSLEDVSLHIPASEYFVLLGPTGAGKTLLIECLCGLRRIQAGRIHVGQSEVTRLEPRYRGIGYVPQDYALFPHRTVRGNIAYGLEHRGLSHRTVSRRVEDLLGELALDHISHRRCENLSGGEKQRVALARALAVEPKVLLLDEPVSALDEQTRDALCSTLKRIQKATGATTLHVCHSFLEMLSVADRVGVLYRGQFLQVGTPQEVLERPRCREVAEFVQARNLLRASAHAAGDIVRLVCSGGLELKARKPEWGVPEGDVTAVIRPENIRLLSGPGDEVPPGSFVLHGAVQSAVNRGPLVIVKLECGPEIELTALLSKRECEGLGTRPGAKAIAAIAPEDVHVMRAMSPPG